MKLTSPSPAGNEGHQWFARRSQPRLAVSALQEGVERLCVLLQVGAAACVSLTLSNPAFDDSFRRSSAAYTAEDSEEQRFATLAVLECRGCELTEFDPKARGSASPAI